MLKNGIWIGVSVVFCFQWIVQRALGIHHSPLMEAVLSGSSIFGAAFLLSWAAELAQLEIPQSLAIAFLALVAVLPEYAVSIYFAWMAGKNPSYIAYATANMTGANRLLIGLGWPAVLCAYWFVSGKKNILLDKNNSTELLILLLASLYAFVIPIKGTLSVLDSVVFLALFGSYVYFSSKASVKEPELEGPAEMLARLSVRPRRFVTVLLFGVAAAAIYLAAEPFSESLLAVGRQFGVEEFILVQWLAPLASEAPEFIVATIFAVKLLPSVGLQTLVASKVNQWTLLVGMLPLAFGISAGQMKALPLDPRQVVEMLLTTAQSVFALVILMNFDFSILEAGVLAFLFCTQLFFTQPWVRYLYSVVYVLLALWVLWSQPRYRQSLWDLLWKSWRRD